MTRIAGVLAVLALFAMPASGADATSTAGRWQAAQRHLSFPLYRPTKRLGLRLNGFEGKGRIVATYGTYHGDVATGHGFLIIEGWPNLGSNPPYSHPIGRVAVNGRRGTLGVYCLRGHACNGFKQGFTFFVVLRSSTGRRTAVYLDSAHLTKPQFLRVVKSLRPVARR